MAALPIFLPRIERCRAVYKENWRMRVEEEQLEWFDEEFGPRGVATDVRLLYSGL